MPRKLKYVIAFLILLTPLLVANSWLPSLPSLVSGKPGNLVYETDEITVGPVRRFVSTSGPVRALVTVSVGSQLSGQIQTLKADFNTEVKAGDELAIMDDKSFVARVAQARSDLAAAHAMLANHEAALLKAEAIERNAERVLARQQTLSDKGIAAVTSLDNAIREFDVAKAEVAIAKAQIQNTKATIGQRQAQLAQAEIDLDRTRIKSPINGTVIARTVDVGQTVAASLQAPELFKIAQDLRRIRIEAQISEADVGAVTAGSAVDFRVDAYPDRSFKGRVVQVRLGGVELNNVVTYTVIIEADNDDRKLLPGMTAEANVESERIDRTLRISTDALRFKPRGMTARPASKSKDRVQSEFERAKTELALTDAQAQSVLGVLRAPGTDVSNAPGAVSAETSTRMLSKGADGASMHRLIAAVARVITDRQSGSFETWKAQLITMVDRARRRDVTVWIVNEAGNLESRQIDIGLMDDNFAEVVGTALREGDRVVVRSREAGRS